MFNWVQSHNNTGVSCTLACHFRRKTARAKIPLLRHRLLRRPNPPTTTSSYTQQYNTNNYCMGYIYSRVGQTALNNLLNQASTSSNKKQVPGFPITMLPDMNNTVTPGANNSLIKGNTKSRSGQPDGGYVLPVRRFHDCIQLRLDAVGYAVTQLFITANAYDKLTSQFRIGLYPFIRVPLLFFSLTTTSTDFLDAPAPSTTPPRTLRRSSTPIWTQLLARRHAHRYRASWYSLL